MAEFRMPKLSDTMEEGTVLQWLRAEGDDVAKGEPIVEIESDKANMMVEAPDSGVLTIIAEEGETLPVGAPIATIGDGAAPAARPAEPADEMAAGEPGPVDADDEAATAVVDEAAAAVDEVGDDAESTGGIPTADDGTGGAIGMALETYPGAEDEEPEPAAVPQAAPEPAPARTAADDGDRVKASPLARRLAADLGIDLDRIRGTGPAGRIVRADVEAAARAPAVPAAVPDAEPEAAPAPSPAPAARAPRPPAPALPPAPAPAAPGERIPLTRLQQTVAKRMALSKPGAPHFYLERDVDVSHLLGLRRELVTASPEGQGPSVNDLVVRAVALAAAERPEALARFDGDALVAPSGIHVGVAVAIPRGLLVPVVRDADAKRVGQLAAEIRDLAARCRDGTITPRELEGSVIRVSNLGMYGIDRFAAVINPPEAAILAVGRARPTPVAEDGEVVVRDVMTLTLSVDHRALYGAEAAVLLGRIAELLERPGALVL